METNNTQESETEKIVYKDASGGFIEHEKRSVARNEEVTKRNIIHQIIYLIMSIVNGLILLRVLLSLFGANRSNVFADSIYSVTSPLVSPFRTLFSVDTRVGETGGRFEIESIVAIVVYSLMAWVLIRVFAVGIRNGGAA